MNGTLQRYLGKLVTVLAPVLYGFAMAYLLAPIVNWIEGLIRKGLKRLSKGQEPKLRGGLLRGVSILLTWAVVAYLLYLLMSVLIPQLIDSVAMLINNAESYYNKIYVWVTNLLEKNPEIAGWMETNLENYYNDLMKVLTEQVLPGAQQMLTTITGGIWTGIWGLVTFTTNFLVGIIISVYLLAMKEKSLAGAASCCMPSCRRSRPAGRCGPPARRIRSSAASSGARCWTPSSSAFCASSAAPSSHCPTRPL